MAVENCAVPTMCSVLAVVMLALDQSPSGWQAGTGIAYVIGIPAATIWTARAASLSSANSIRQVDDGAIDGVVSGHSQRVFTLCNNAYDTANDWVVADDGALCKDQPQSNIINGILMSPSSMGVFTMKSGSHQWTSASTPTNVSHGGAVNYWIEASDRFGDEIKTRPMHNGGVSGKDFKDTRLQIRLASGGTPYVTTLPSDSTLHDVAEYVAAQTLSVSVDTVSFTQHFPRKTFTQAEFGKTLKELGLTPSAVLIAS